MTVERTTDECWTPEAISYINREAAASSVVEGWVDEWSLSSDIKLLLKQLSRQVITAERTIINIGRWVVTHLKNILDEVVRAFADGVGGFKYTLTGAVVGLALSLMLASMPVLGVLAGMLGPVIGLAVMCIGAYADAVNLTFKPFISSVPSTLRAAV